MTKTKKAAGVLALIFMLFALLLTMPIRSAKAEDPIEDSSRAYVPVDVYLIMGQSNAAGCSRFYGVPETFPNIMMAGRWEPKLDGSARYNMLIMDDMLPVTSGFGKDNNHIGPEYGMAEVLNEHYSPENKAIFFKYATGGTRLLNIVKNGTIDTAAGTWYPRSLQESTDAYQNGAMYNGFITAFTTFARSLNNNGYIPNIRAIAWMQGEADRGMETRYKEVIQVFVQDLREDLQRIGALNAPHAIFTMGEISETFGSADQYSVATNLNFIAMQNEAAELPKMMPSISVDTHDLNINAADGVVLGTDSAHWNQADMITLGTRFANAMLECSSGGYAVAEAEGNGTVSVDKRYFAYGDDVTFTVTADYSGTLAAFYVNDVDKTAELVDGKYTATNAPKFLKARAVFDPKPLYDVRIEGDHVPTLSSPRVFDGATAYVCPYPPVGKEVASVTFTQNGSNKAQKMTWNAEKNRYEINNVTGPGTIKITYQDIGAGDKKEGCKNAVTSALTMLTVLAAALFIFKK